MSQNHWKQHEESFTFFQDDVILYIVLKDGDSSLQGIAPRFFFLQPINLFLFRRISITSRPVESLIYTNNIFQITFFSRAWDRGFILISFHHRIRYSKTKTFTSSLLNICFVHLEPRIHSRSLLNKLKFSLHHIL